MNKNFRQYLLYYDRLQEDPSLTLEMWNKGLI